MWLLARKAKKKKSGCLLPIIIIFVILGLIGSGGDKESPSTTPTTAPTAIVETTAATSTATAEPASTAAAIITEAPTEAPTKAPTATPKPTATPTAKPTATAAPTKKAEQTYTLNKSTKKFHYPSCSSAKKIKDSNKGSFTGTRDELIQKGYSPCGDCHP